MDETGIRTNEPLIRGWSLKGRPCFGTVSGKKEERINILGAWCNGQFFAGVCQKAYTNATLFIDWVKTALLPHLRSGQYLVLDNASFHCHPELRPLLASKGCQPLYLPPYSPDFNPIEHFWAFLKNTLRKAWSPSVDPLHTVRYVLQSVSASFSV
jgi:transposase